MKWATASEVVCAVARFTGLHLFPEAFLGLAPQALCLRLLRRLRKTSHSS
jgi:hypothetical protein